jgi:dedicated sortase system histidine kinase
VKLRAQLLLVSLSLLILPWAVFLFTAELDTNLRANQLSAAQSRTDAVAVSVADALQQETSGIQGFGNTVRPESKTLLAARFDSPILLDGYAHDWATFELTQREFLYTHNKISVEPEDVNAASTLGIHAAARRGRLYLFLRVTDDRLLYHQPERRAMANGDSIIIRVQTEDGSIRRYTFRWEAPGRALGRYYGDVFEGERPIFTDNRYIASMVETATGYHVEMRMPLPRDDVFGLSVVDLDKRAGVPRWTGMFDPNELDDTGQLKVVDATLTDQLAVFADAGMRVRVFDAQGWLRADADQRAPDATVREFEPESANLFDAVLYRFISWSLSKNVDAQKMSEIESGKLDGADFTVFERLSDNGPGFFKDKYNRVFLTALQRITVGDDLHGYALLQQPRAALSDFTETAILRLVKIFGFAILLVAAVLLSYATLLSWRIRKLRNEVEGVVAVDGKITGSIDASSAPDEIGDLNRSFDGIINRLGNYTGYLQSLGSKLSHELRTPLSVVTTSLENIDKQTLDQRSQVSVERAQQGAARLQKLIRNLSEASSLEQTITLSEKTTVDLREWIRVAGEVYTGTYPDRRFEVDVESRGDLHVTASLELLYQMLDKLVSNALDFSLPDSAIVLGLYGLEDGVVFYVENRGAPLPEHMIDELFEPMVTQREHRDDQPHMGLGLYIVKLIADYHSANVRAVNIDSARAVRFEVTFPRTFSR